MTVNQALAQVSDLAFQAAAAAYLTALICHAAQLAARQTPQSAAGPVLTRQARTPTVGGPAAPGAIGLLPRRGPVPWPDRFARAAVLVTTIGLAAQLLSIITRGLAVQRAPWGNMYEFASMITAAAVATWLIVLTRTRVRSIGMFVLLPIVILVFVAGTVLYVPASSLVPALQTYWLVIHVLAISVATGMLMLSGVASGLYLLRTRSHPSRTATGRHDPADATRQRRGPFAALPSPDTLDRIAYRTAIVAFPVYTFAVLAGAMWAEAAWGRYWGWDPKETTAFITWIIYAGYLHARATAGWRGRRAAWIPLLGLAAILFNLFFVNMVVSGLHSYAGLN
jgi:cytochrome c-type biogenesis protein CcsB